MLSVKTALKCYLLIASDFEGETENVNSEQEYLNLINRGGLTKPSDILFMTCIHACTLYSHIQASADAYQILMACCNPRNLFVETFLQKLVLQKLVIIQPFSFCRIQIINTLLMSY